eukprot:TRINITY_DN9238_c0_g1_i1.p1 TRINITY_DN9238_c0_g1~~TRINITY_DN9238_c0_g1_i1.p1  ORF type:complete len:306 (-),score=91.02 TRINITY_DN9238_c0_g1_i1:115-996(-)
MQQQALLVRVVENLRAAHAHAKAVEKYLGENLPETSAQVQGHTAAVAAAAGEDCVMGQLAAVTQAHSELLQRIEQIVVDHDFVGNCNEKLGRSDKLCRNAATKLRQVIDLYQEKEKQCAVLQLQLQALTQPLPPSAVATGASPNIVLMASPALPASPLLQRPPLVAQQGSPPPVVKPAVVGHAGTPTNRAASASPPSSPVVTVSPNLASGSSNTTRLLRSMSMNAAVTTESAKKTPPKKSKLLAFAKRRSRADLPVGNGEEALCEVLYGEQGTNPEEGACLSFEEMLQEGLPE